MLDILVLIGFLPVAYRCAARSWKDSLLFSGPMALALPPLLLLILPSVLHPAITLSPASIIGITVLSLILSTEPGLLKRSIRFGIYLQRDLALFLTYSLGIVHLVATSVPALQQIAENGLSAALTRDRLSVYFSDGIGRGDPLLPVRLITEPIFFGMIGYLYVHKCRFLSLFISFGYIFAIALTANTRLSLVFPIIAVIGGAAYQARMKRHIILVIGCTIAAILPWYAYVTNMVRHGIDLTSTAGEFAYTYTLGEIDYNKYVAAAVEHASESGIELGYGWLLGSAGNLIPRSLWVEKPVTSTSNRFTEAITGEPPSMTNPVITFTIIGEGFLQFGFFGVVIEVIFYTIVMSKIFWSLFNQRSEIGAFVAVHFATTILVYFRAEIPFTQICVSLFALWILASLARKHSSPPQRIRQPQTVEN